MALIGQLVPEPMADIMHVAAIQLEISHGSQEVGVLILGLYGNLAPGSVQELLDFISDNGLTTLTSTTNANMVGRIMAPVTLKQGGVIDSIVPGLYVSLGVPSQTYANAGSQGMAKVDGFVPQPQLSPLQVSQDTSNVHLHLVAGLLSVPNKGLGYSSSTFSFDGDDVDDETYASSFLIMASLVPALDDN